MVKGISSLQSGDKLEALFDEDNRWYRASVTKATTDCVQVYFLDYGNSENYPADQVPNKLRFRTSFKDAEEKEVFSLDYQAIRCVYSTDNKKTLEDFIGKLSEEVEDVENGFDITVKEVVALDIDHLSYRFVLAIEEPGIPYQEAAAKSVVQNFKEGLIREKRMNSETEADHEVSSILKGHLNINKNNNNNIELELNKDHVVSICHIETTNEFYVQLAGNIKELMEHFQRIQLIAELAQKHSDTKHQVGDLVLARYHIDDTWYKGLVTQVDKKTGLYEVYFVDYGNTEANNSPVDLRSMSFLYETVSNKQELIDDLNAIIEFPFQAICCQLENKRASIRNTEILKTLVTDCFNFTIKTKSRATQSICELLEIKKNVVNLYSEDKLLDVNFEDQIEALKLKPPVMKEQEQEVVNDEPVHCQKLSLNSVHEFRTAFFGGDEEIHLHLTNEQEELEKLHEELNSKRETDNLQAAIQTNVKVGDVVLAKFYEEDRVTFSWYRARVNHIDSDHKYTVSYLGKWIFQNEGRYLIC